MGAIQVTAGSNLTVPAEIILTVALGLAVTGTSTHEAVDIAPTAVVSQPSTHARGLLTTATDSRLTPFDANLSAIRANRSDSRWHRYVSRRLIELRNGEHDFTGFQVPSAEVIERARFLANSIFEPEHPTPSVVPSEEGDVLYIWHKAGWDLEIDVGLEEISVWVHNRRTGKEWYGSLEELRAPVAELLDSLAWH